MKFYLSIFCLVLLFFITNSCNRVSSPFTVKICNQVWMIKNLDVDKYSNGDPIPKVISSKQWDTLTTGAYCYYNNSKDSAITETYGKLYNWYAVNDARGLAPKGWHVPSSQEMATLMSCLGGYLTAGSILKSTATNKEPKIPDYWAAPNTGATNSSGFTGLPGGWRAYGVFNKLGFSGTWWSASQTSNLQATNLSLYYDNGICHISNNNKQTGFSVRCVKDY